MINNNKKLLQDIARYQKGFFPIVKVNKDNNWKSKNAKVEWLKCENLHNLEITDQLNYFLGILSRSRVPKGFGKLGETELCSQGESGFVWCDIDHISVNEAKERIEGAGLPVPTYLVNSGGGVHCYYMLDNAVPKGLAYKLSYALTMKLKADIKAVLFTQFLRLAGSRNFKHENAFCDVVDYSERYFQVSELQDLLQQELQGLKADKSAMPNKSNEFYQKVMQDVKGYCNKNGFVCVLNMLGGVQQGERNFCLGRITKLLQVMGLGQGIARSFVIEWNRLNSPMENEMVVLNSFEMYWRRPYNLLGCVFNNPQLNSILGKFCDRNKCQNVECFEMTENNNLLGVNNQIFLNN